MPKVVVADEYVRPFPLTPTVPAERDGRKKEPMTVVVELEKRPAPNPMAVEVEL